MTILFTYLGVPVGGNHGKVDFWPTMLSKMRKRLATWKGRLISFAGRVTLIKFVIFDIPLYFILIFKMSHIMLNAIVKMQRNFLWG